MATVALVKYQYVVTHLLASLCHQAAYLDKQGEAPRSQDQNFWHCFFSCNLHSLKLTYSTWKLMVGILLSFWEGLFSGAMLVLGRVNAPHFFWGECWYTLPETNSSPLITCFSGGNVRLAGVIDRDFFNGNLNEVEFLNRKTSLKGVHWMNY